MRYLDLMTPGRLELDGVDAVIGKPEGFSDGGLWLRGTRGELFLPGISTVTLDASAEVVTAIRGEKWSVFGAYASHAEAKAGVFAALRACAIVKAGKRGRVEADSAMNEPEPLAEPTVEPLGELPSIDDLVLPATQDAEPAPKKARKKNG